MKEFSDEYQSRKKDSKISTDRNIKIRESEIDRLKNSLTNDNNYDKVKDEQFEYLLKKLQNNPIVVTRLDYYGNAIPLGAFCYGISFVLLGFFETKIYDQPDNFINLILLFFGGLGQITAGIFEYIKSRTFPTILYLLYGFYFMTYFLLNNYSSNENLNDYNKIFYSSWAGLSFPIFIGSIRANIIYLIQNLAVFALFIVKCIGIYKDIDIFKELISGILELVTGFLSIYIFFSQIINEHFKKNILPTIKLKTENEIDIDPTEKKYF